MEYDIDDMIFGDHDPGPSGGESRNGARGKTLRAIVYFVARGAQSAGRGRGGFMNPSRLPFMTLSMLPSSYSVR